ncbi:ABC transporter substrate-binding protein [Rhizobium sp. S152]|uniref:ABC transporter substrate-binding protein n=1 Tax=Rhizobium sp. S152 TaxID=3055038 RepID=UPI0025A9FE95|nr:ABC transporter substrate-binding protein [Rhizobium sp. S152]MDM9624658.1 ABC transporter substrate-binding protein [Rhizobium sp. S152]
MDRAIGRRSLMTIAALGFLETCARPVRAYTQPRLVAIDWAAADTLLALDIVPLAVSDVETYRQWLPDDAPKEMLDLGSRAEPNMELIAALGPDAIFISNWQSNLAEQLRRVAPTHAVMIIAPGSDPLQNSQTELFTLAKLYGREKRAHELVAGFDASLSRRSSQISAIGMPPVFVGVLHENGSQLFLYGEGSWVHSLLRQMGLRNALSSPTSAFGNALVDLAELAASPDAILLHLDQGDRTRRAERLLGRSTLWRNLPMVRAGNVHAIAPFYPLGGMLSVERAAGVIADAVLDIDRRRHG